MIARLQRWALAVLAFLAVVAGAVLVGRQGGRKAAELEAVEDTVEKQREVLGVVREVEEDINSSNSSRRRLNDEWMRDADSDSK